MQISESKMEYLKLLARTYKTEDEVEAEIVNLMTIQNLPKGTDYFMSDIHAEYEAFLHILRNASGTIKRRIDEIFPDMDDAERRTLATLIYYPREKLELMLPEIKDKKAFYRDTLKKLVRLLEVSTFKFTRSYVRKRMPDKYAYTLEELIYGSSSAMAYGGVNHQDYIIDSIVEVGCADDFIIIISGLISRVSIFRLHILGDVYDRGPAGELVIDTLMKYPNVDIQWGNHDILWMGAAAGNRACIANVVRNCTKYDNIHTLEVGYGISLRKLETFALRNYPKADNPMMMASAMIQFKVEGQLIKKHKHYEMESLLLLDKINFEDHTINIGGKVYKLNSSDFPTVDPADPYKLTAEEEEIMQDFEKEFAESRILQQHVRYLFDYGSFYKVLNGNLLFHGCIPMTADGEFDPINTEDGYKYGKEWFDYAEKLVRTGYFSKGGRDKQRGVDLFWYLWCGYKSPMFGKEKITTFERLFIDDKETHVEKKNPYYELYDRVDVVEKLLKEFGGDPENGIVINGHVPVKKGSSPIHAGGRLIVIDGGFAKAYQKTTGIAGYTLVQNSNGFLLSAHDAFTTKERAVAEELDIKTIPVQKEPVKNRIRNKDTDAGRARAVEIDNLKLLLEAYKAGLIKQ
ncbi:MAG: fructose-1,6-bisphosphatase [Firmicutes bacterium]|nr:fructose-1,6-bisphosphatase [Bacillota bacterium]